jgi:hypothetical protein
MRSLLTAISIAFTVFTAFSPFRPIAAGPGYSGRQAGAAFDLPTLLPLLPA